MHRELTIQERRRLYEQAVVLIRREYATDLSVNDVARRLFTSRRQLQRVFADAGTSFRTVCRQARMAAARKMLRAYPEMTVAEIARAVGYRQPAQFAKAFRREAGMPPTEYRAKSAAVASSITRRASHPRTAVSRAQLAQLARDGRASQATSLEHMLGLTG